MADALRMDICEGTEKLVNVKFDLENRHSRLHLVEISRRTIDRLGNIFLHQVEIHLILLGGKLLAVVAAEGGRGNTYSLSI